MKKQKLHFSRLLSLALSLALLCTALSVPFSVSANGEGTATGLGTSATDPWNGTTISTSLEGTGSSGNPYKINNAADLAYLAQKCGYLGSNTSTEGLETNNKHFELTTDIYLNDVSTEWYKDPTDATGLKEWKNTGTFAHSGGTGTAVFHGHLHGNGHKIYGLYMNDDSNYGGLFARTNANASIENLGIEKSYIAVSMTSGDAGALVGYRGDSWGAAAAITNCYSSDTVTVKGANAGGLVGHAYHKLTFTNCYSSAALTKGSTKVTDKYGYAGGLLGLNRHGTTGNVSFVNCYNAQSSNLSLAGGFTTFPSYINCYSTIGATGVNGTTVNVLTLAQMTGEAAYENMSGFAFNTVWHAFDGTPKLRVFDFPGKNLEPEIWNGTTAAGFAGGTGASGDPFLISNGAQLAYLISLSKATWGYSYNKYFKLTSDIYLNNVSASDWYVEKEGVTLNPWTPSGFYGYLDGDGHVIHGIYINDSTTVGEAGLFSNISYGAGTSEIKNLGIEDSYISATKNGSTVGAFAAMKNWGSINTTFSNCYVSDTVILQGNTDSAEGIGSNVGGFVGYLGDCNLTLNNCYSSLNGSGRLVGALVGTGGSNLTINRCYSTQAKDDLVRNGGGSSTFTNCYAAHVFFLKDKTGITPFTAEQMLGDGMENLVKAQDNAGKNVWFTNPKSTPKLAVFPIDGDVNRDRTVDICDLVLAKQVSLGTAGYNLINFATTNLDNSDGKYIINEADINKIRAGKLLGLDF